MKDKMKRFYLLVVRQVALENMPIRNNPSSQNFGKEPMLIFLIVKMITSVQIR